MVTKKRIWGALLVLFLSGLNGCTARHHSLKTIDKSMEYHARERYLQALRYMEANRFELAREEFAIVKKTAASPELYELAKEGYAKTTAVIAARR